MAESNLREFLDSCFPLCSTRARVAKNPLFLLSSWFIISILYVNL